MTLNCHSITRHLSVYIEYNLFSLLSFKCSVVFHVLFLKGQGYNTSCNNTHTHAQSILGTQSVISLRGQFLARALAIFIRLDSIVTEYTSEDIKPTGFFYVYFLNTIQIEQRFVGPSNLIVQKSIELICYDEKNH